MPTVNNPPALIAQQTGAWCFAAAELMARNYYGLDTPSQYEIARASLMALVEAEDPIPFQQWNAAGLNDLLNNQEEDNGNNLNSERVQLVRNNYGAINHDAINGRLAADFAFEAFKVAINSNKIVIIGNAIHYFVVYGYDEQKAPKLLVRDPWPANVGGQQTEILYATFAAWNNRVVIHF
jgi:Peptidase_C39 like family